MKYIMTKHKGWSIHYKRCIRCGLKDYAHASHGLCFYCYRRGSKCRSYLHLPEARLKDRIDHQLHKSWLKKIVWKLFFSKFIHEVSAS